MNHQTHTKTITTQTFLGPMMFVRAARALDAGAELSTQYFEDEGTAPPRPASWIF